jgi:hypothetical protein
MGMDPLFLLDVGSAMVSVVGAGGGEVQMVRSRACWAMANACAALGALLEKLRVRGLFFFFFFFFFRVCAVIFLSDDSFLSLPFPERGRASAATRRRCGRRTRATTRPWPCCGTRAARCARKSCRPWSPSCSPRRSPPRQSRTRSAATRCARWAISAESPRGGSSHRPRVRVRALVKTRVNRANRAVGCRLSRMMRIVAMGPLIRPHSRCRWCRRPHRCCCRPPCRRCRRAR